MWGRHRQTDYESMRRWRVRLARSKCLQQAEARLDVGRDVWDAEIDKQAGSLSPDRRVIQHCKNLAAEHWEVLGNIHEEIQKGREGRKSFLDRIINTHPPGSVCRVLMHRQHQGIQPRFTLSDPPLASAYHRTILDGTMARSLQ